MATFSSIEESQWILSHHFTLQYVHLKVENGNSSKSHTMGSMHLGGFFFVHREFTNQFNFEIFQACEIKWMCNIFDGMHEKAVRIITLPLSNFAWKYEKSDFFAWKYEKKQFFPENMQKINSFACKYEKKNFAWNILDMNIWWMCTKAPDSQWIALNGNAMDLCSPEIVNRWQKLHFLRGLAACHSEN